MEVCHPEGKSICIVMARGFRSRSRGGGSVQCRPFVVLYTIDAPVRPISRGSRRHDVKLRLQLAGWEGALLSAGGAGGLDVWRGAFSPLELEAS